MRSLVLLLFLALPVAAQDGPTPMGDVFVLSKDEVEKINSLLEEAADIIKRQRKEIDKLKASTGCV